MMPLNVAATLVKLAIPPPMMRILPLGLGVPRVMRSTFEMVSQIVFRPVLAGKRTNGLGVLVSLPLGGCTTVLSIVGKLVRKPMRGNRVTVHNTGSSTSNHGPNASLRVKNGEL